MPMPCGGRVGAVAVAADHTRRQCPAPGHGRARWSGLQDKMYPIRRAVRRFATLWRYVHSLRVHHRLRGPGSLALAQAIRHDRLTRTRVHCRACTRSPCRCARGAKNEPAASVGLLGPHKTGAPPAMGICSCDHGTRIQKLGQRRL